MKRNAKAPSMAWFRRSTEGKAHAQRQANGHGDSSYHNAWLSDCFLRVIANDSG
jgi:hypothetical protein